MGLMALASTAICRSYAWIEYALVAFVFALVCFLLGASVAAAPAAVATDPGARPGPCPVAWYALNLRTGDAPFYGCSNHPLWPPPMPLVLELGA